MRALAFLLPALLALAACDSGTQGADMTAEEAAAEGNLAANSSVAPVPGQGSGPDAALIPAAVQGRWGLTAADCEPDRADAKGLLTVTAERLEFYESVGELDDIREVDEDRIHASFDFTGEGMDWERDMALELQEAGGALVRREYGADAAPGSFRYTKCN